MAESVFFVRVGRGTLSACLPLIVGIGFIVGTSLPQPAYGQPRSLDQRLYVSGRVVDSAGKPVPYAHVFESLTGSAVITSRDGEFSLASLDSSGTAVLVVRRIGYRPLDALISAMEKPSRVELVLQRIAGGLEPLTIRARASDYDDYLDRSGFYRRMALQPDGSFITARQIDRRTATEITAVLRDVPGIRVISRNGRGGKNNYVAGRGGLCALGLVVDGQRIDTNAPPRESTQPRITSIVGSRPTSSTHGRQGDASIDEIVPPAMVGGIEVYPSHSSVPNGFAHHVDGCGLIVVWTRYHR